LGFGTTIHKLGSNSKTQVLKHQLTISKLSVIKLQINIWCLVYKPVNAGPKKHEFWPLKVPEIPGKLKDFFRWYSGCPGGYVLSFVFGWV
jgi:hypothetical protein